MEVSSRDTCAKIATKCCIWMMILIPSSSALTILIEDPPFELGYANPNECDATSEFASVIGDFRQCSCSDNGCCFSTEPEWWLEWGVCEDHCCIKSFGPVALALCPVAAALIAVAGCSAFYCCYKGKCCRPLRWMNLNIADSSAESRGKQEEGVMFVPNIMFDNGDANCCWQNSGSSFAPLNSHSAARNSNSSLDTGLWPQSKLGP